MDFLPALYVGNAPAEAAWWPGMADRGLPGSERHESVEAPRDLICREISK
jgi:hypothetical protein